MDSQRNFKMDVIGLPSMEGDTTEIQKSIELLSSDINTISETPIKINTEDCILKDSILIDVNNYYKPSRWRYDYDIPDSANKNGIYVDIKLKKRLTGAHYFELLRGPVSWSIEFGLLPIDTYRILKHITTGNKGAMTLSFYSVNTSVTDYIESISYSFDGYDNLDHTIVISESDYNKDTSISNDALCLLTTD